MAKSKGTTTLDPKSIEVDLDTFAAEMLRAELLTGKPPTRPQSEAEKAFVKRNAARLAKGEGDAQE